MKIPHSHLKPYNIQNLKLVPQNVEAFKLALRAIPGRPGRVVESYGGVGAQSQAIQDIWPGIEHDAWERDEACHVELSKVNGVSAHHGDYPCPPLAGDTLLVADANDFTVKNNGPYLSTLNTQAGWIVLTDIARGKLHLHPGAYGLEVADFDLYVEKVGELLQRKVLFHSKGPRSITYIQLGDKL